MRTRSATGGGPGKPRATRPPRPRPALPLRGGEPPPPRREPAPPGGARHLKKSGGVLRRGGDMTFRFIEEHRDQWPVCLLCATLAVSPAGRGWWDGPRGLGSGSALERYRDPATRPLWAAAQRSRYWR